jgi:hypothetical protein
VELAEGILFMRLAEGMLFVELQVAGDWWWRSDRTDNRPELDFGLFDGLVMEIAKGKMEHTGGEGEPIAWCG